MPFIEAKLDGRTEKFMFDLGSSTLISLTDKAARRHTKGKELIEIFGGAMEGGNGIRKTLIYIFKANSFEIGNAPKYTNKPVVFTKLLNENLIGNPIIKDYVVTLNFRENELYLTPMSDTQTMDGWNSFGLNMEYKADKLVVTTIFNGLPAQIGGVNVNDEILTVNEQPVSCYNYCDCKMTIDHLLQSNSIITLGIKNGDTIRQVRLTKEKIY
jgi:hypothetical protein